jgi:hypothetical protein
MKIFEQSDRAKITHIFPAPIGDVLLQRSADFSSILHILNQIFRDSHNLEKSLQFCPRIGAKIIKSLRSPSGDNSTCPIHPAEYRRRFSPRSVFFNADMQAQDHHARYLRDSPKLVRSAVILRTKQSALAGAHGIGVDDLTSIDLTRAVHDLRD